MILVYNSSSRALHEADGPVFTKASFDSLKLRAAELEIQFECMVSNLPRIRSITANIENIATVEELIAKVAASHEEIVSALQEVDRLASTVISATPVYRRADVDWRALALAEEQYRLSDEVALAYAAMETDASPVDWIEYTATVVQPELLRRHGIEPTEFNLHRLRVAAQDTDVFWVKYNRAREGELRAGSAIPGGDVLYDVLNQTKIAPDLRAFYGAVSSFADVALVYIAEAHAADEWSIHSSRCTVDDKAVEITQPRTLEERSSIAQAFTASYGLTDLRLLVDDPAPVSNGGVGDEFNRLFSPWPLRFYVLYNGIVEWIAEPSEGRFDVGELESALKAVHERVTFDGVQL